jgi:hypothetical protein
VSLPLTLSRKVEASLLIPNHSWSMSNNKHLYQGNHSWSFPFLLDSLSLLYEHTHPFLYGCHPPLDVNLTHWSSSNAPTLPLLDFISVFHLSLQPYLPKAIGNNIINISFMLVIFLLTSVYPHLKGPSIDHAL